MLDDLFQLLLGDAHPDAVRAIHDEDYRVHVAGVDSPSKKKVFERHENHKNKVEFYYHINIISYYHTTNKKNKKNWETTTNHGRVSFEGNKNNNKS